MPVIEVEWIKAKCAYCSGEWLISPSRLRTRIKVSKSGKVFCSKKCAQRYRYDPPGAVS